ncbi:chromatin-remodeling protein [Saccharomycopsis crataegensis]|uniref:FACT complex subunit n=1 Tax=Saccharomycopsis crataegensis TaxID=43959 RepID=A0AAV5QF15_9ASCO|nr:chromatin-remodeling protein [Saccharomycopsis crataegensis]
MSEIYIDPGNFKKRVQHIQRKLSDAAIFNNTQSLLIVIGANDEGNPYQKSTVLHNWLLGYQFPATALLITKQRVIFVTSGPKARHLSGVKSPNVLIWTRNKDPEHNKKLFENLVEEIKSAGDKVGVLTKDKFEGKFVDEWNSVWSKEEDAITKVDIGAGLSQVMEVKDDEEIRYTRLACRASSIMLDYFSDEMVTIVDEEKSITNMKLSEKIENKIDDAKFFNDKKKKLSNDFDPNSLDWSYSPIIQSGGKFDLKPSAQSNKDKLNGGVILASIGLRYKNYCSTIGRSFLIDPTKEIEKNYDFLLKIQKRVFSFLKDGVTGKAVYGAAIDLIKKERPELESHFVKNVGWLSGIEFKDNSCVLNAKNERTIHAGSVFDVVIGFNNLENKEAKDPKDKIYALSLIDTIRVTNGEPVTLTEGQKAKSDISFFFKDDGEDEKIKNESGEDVKPKVKSSSSVPKKRKNEEILSGKSKILKTKLRGEAKNSDDHDQELIRQASQKKLHEKRQKEGLARFSAADQMNPDEQKPVFKRYESYVRETQLPTNVKDLRIHVDPKSQTILVPVCGRPVPFHVNAYKNGSKTEEGEYTYIRLNFNSPGGIAARKGDLPYEEGDDNTFIRSITFRSKDGQRLSRVFQQISDLKKAAIKRESEKKAMAGVIEQAKLILNKPGRVKRLDSVAIRPAPDSKKAFGTVFIHENGLRYQSPIRPDQKVDILFSNIKHLFFQPSQDELIVLIHCHLKNPLMIGKKKTYDIQFYREASDGGIDETGGRRRKYRYGDDDELEQEEEERRRRMILDREFKTFAETISDASNGLVDLDIPFRELGFDGVPLRSSVFLMPSRDCLVQLIDTPFLVVTLAEVEVAHLERVQFGLKNFDLVFVFKDFSKPVVHINTIPMTVLEDVKNWLTDVDIPFSEGRISLNWAQIMKTIVADPHGFFEDGGWSFLTGDGSDEEESESEEESAFELSSEGEEDDDEEEEEEDDYSSEEFSDEESEASASETDEGEDWDEMERKAAREDSRKEGGGGGGGGGRRR